MGKRGKSQKGAQKQKKSKLNLNKDADFNDLDDEIDAFHKKRDVIPLDVNADSGDSDGDDDELPVFDYKGIGSDDDDEDDDEEDEYDDSNLKGLAAKIVRQQKYLREKTGGVDDEMDDDDEDDEEKYSVWSKGKHGYYGNDTNDYELQSSDEDAQEEEEEVVRMQKDRVKSLRHEDFGLETDEDDSDKEPTLEEMVDGKTERKRSGDKEAEDDAVPMYEEVKKDLSTLSRDEQMDVVYSSAPELVGLLDELGDAVKQLETQVNPLLAKVRKEENAKKDGMHYLEVKQLLLLSYCQAITFYLLLKSDGQPVRDHPVIERLVEIKSLLDKIKELDGHIPDGLEDLLNKSTTAAQKPAAKLPAFSSDMYAEHDELTGLPSQKQDASKYKETAEPVKMQSVEVKSKKGRIDKCQDQPVSSESVKMLQHRAALEEKLNQKSISGSDASKTDGSKKRKRKIVTGNLETTDDFDDDAMEMEGTTHENGRASTLSSKLSRIIPAKKSKGVSGDDDLPERDDLGERRWKHELRVLARAGIKSNNDDAQPENHPESLDDHGVDDGDNDGAEGSEDDLYNVRKRQREAKQKMKAEKYSRIPLEQYEPETTFDGKRHITTQIDKNRGLTRNRKKAIKNPRKKYRTQHEKAVNRRKGQVRDIKKPAGPYGGETTGINTRISRSVRF